MKVKVRAFLTMKEVMGNQSSLELNLEEGTILSLLKDLGEKFGEEFIGRVFESGKEELSGQVLVLVNGRNYSNLPEGLETPLKEGDEVAIFPPIAGG